MNRWSSSESDNIPSLWAPLNQHEHSAVESGSYQNGLNKEDIQQRSTKMSTNPSRYKTEICRSFEETGECKYGDKCQFAHGSNEMRFTNRHPKYKTQYCRTFHSFGFCPYGPRCHFIHNDSEAAIEQDASVNNECTSLTSAATGRGTSVTNPSFSPIMTSPNSSMSSPSLSSSSGSQFFFEDEHLNSAVKDVFRSENSLPNSKARSNSDLGSSSCIKEAINLNNRFHRLPIFTSLNFSSAKKSLTIPSNSP